MDFGLALPAFLKRQKLESCEGTISHLVELLSKSFERSTIILLVVVLVKEE
jgi:hypothetical protein